MSEPELAALERFAQSIMAAREAKGEGEGECAGSVGYEPGSIREARWRGSSDM